MIMPLHIWFQNLWQVERQAEQSYHLAEEYQEGYKVSHITTGEET